MQLSLLRLKKLLNRLARPRTTLSPSRIWWLVVGGYLPDARRFRGTANKRNEAHKKPLQKKNGVAVVTAIAFASLSGSCEMGLRGERKIGGKSKTNCFAIFLITFLGVSR
jgi:hypothetical protein